MEARSDTFLRMVQLSDVAAEAGVSKSVASRVLNGAQGARVSTATRSRVTEAADRLGYVPSMRSRALRFSRSDAIGLVIPDVNNSVFSELLAGVEDEAASCGSAVLLGQMTAPGTGRGRLSRLVGNGRVDGVILQRREDADDDALLDSMDTDLPVVLFNSTLPDRAGSVTLEDYRAATMATEHLLQLGHRRIALIGGSQIHDAARRRRSGFLDTLSSAGLVSTSIMNSGWEATSGAKAMKALLNSSQPPSAVVVASVNAALGAASWALTHGVSVPDEISIVAIQDSWMAAQMVPSISVVRMPLRAAGTIATRMLIDYIQQATPLSNVTVTATPPQLVRRSSTAPA